MCIIFAVKRPSSNIKFALAMNRDESFLRESAGLQYFHDTEIYCGKDLVKGGTWLAINKKGWLVAITNIRSDTFSTIPTNTITQSRGLIPFELLKQDKFDPQKWKSIIQSFDCENFNVLFTDLRKLEIYIYSSKSRELSLIPDDQRIFSLTNGGIDSNWFKQSRGIELIENLNENSDETPLFKILTDTKTPVDESDPLDYTKWPIFVKPFLSRGTISSSVILLTNDNEIKFIERTWTENQVIKFENKISFSII